MKPAFTSIPYLTMQLPTNHHHIQPPPVIHHYCMQYKLQYMCVCSTTRRRPCMHCCKLQRVPTTSASRVLALVDTNTTSAQAAEGHGDWAPALISATWSRRQQQQAACTHLHCAPRFTTMLCAVALIIIVCDSPCNLTLPDLNQQLALMV